MSVIHADPLARAQSGALHSHLIPSIHQLPHLFHTKSMRTTSASGDLGQLREVTHEAAWWLAGKAHL